jgi:hypothetical protein
MALVVAPDAVPAVLAGAGPAAFRIGGIIAGAGVTFA